MAVLHLVYPIFFCSLLCVHRKEISFMYRYYLTMLNRHKARKLFLRLILILLLLFHYMYITTFPWNWAVIFSSIACAFLFSDKISKVMLFHCNENMKLFFAYSIIAIVMLFIPCLYTIAVSMATFLLAASMYPSKMALEKWQDHEFRDACIENYKELFKLYN